jgi:uncharacterized protein YdhG (YjbR/CyaY superfamily)
VVGSTSKVYELVDCYVLGLHLMKQKYSSISIVPKDRKSPAKKSRRKFVSVAEYVASLNPVSMKAITRVRKLVKQNVPGSRELISYNIPAFAVKKTFLYCAAFKSHIGIFPPVKGNAPLQRVLEPYSNEKGNLRFPLNEPIPFALIGRVAKALAKQYADGALKKTGRNRREQRFGSTLDK